jgi:hypothetical protein
LVLILNVYNRKLNEYLKQIDFIFDKILF